MGDCKDHSTLLQALLAAKNIESTQALVNASNVYDLPQLPVVSTVNHVINYIPSLNLFLDSTSDSTPFGMLPSSVQDKPVLLVQDFKPGLRTPPSPPSARVQKSKTVASIDEHGHLSGTVAISLQGEPAVRMRALFRDFPKNQEAEYVKAYFKRQGWEGEGVLVKDDAKALADSYHYEIHFKLKEFLQQDSAGAIPLKPLFYSPMPAAYFSSYSVDDDAMPSEFSCSGGMSEELLEIKFPKSRRILAKPADANLDWPNLRYRATYRVKNNVLTVQRKVEDRTLGRVCTAAQGQQFKTFASKIFKNLKAQLVYQ